MIKKLFVKEIIFLPALLLTLFVSVNKVNALESNVATWSYFYTYPDNSYDEKLQAYNTYSSVIDNLKQYFLSNWSSTYDYYYIDYAKNVFTSNHEYIILFPLTSNNFSVRYSSSNLGSILFPTYSLASSNGSQLFYLYDITTSEYKTSTEFGSNFPNSTSIPLFSNFDLVFSDNQYDKLILPSYTDNDYNIPSYELFDLDILPTIETLSNNSYNVYTEIDLNSYDYVILSLTDYNTNPFYTNIYTLGKLCLTPVYNYGMTQKKDIFPTYQTQACTSLYDTFTVVNISVSQTDIDNHALFYIKSYNSSAVNKIRIPSSKFDVTYISSNDSDPQVEIDGRSYPVIPFNDLTDTANISTDTGYISGQVCALGDINCQADTMGMDISDLFTQPLRLLQSVWGAITSVFTLITSFIGFLPPLLQTFLYTSFMLGLIIGIIKIIL